MRRTMKNVVLVTMIFPVAFNLAGCPDRSTVEKSSRAETQAAPRTIGSCQSQVDDLKEWARTVIEPPRIDLPSFLFSKGSMTATELPYVQEHGNTLVLDQGNTTLNGHEVATAEMALSGKWGLLTAALERNEHIRRAIHHHEQRERKIFLSVDKAQVWSTVVSLLKALQTHGIKQIGFLFHTPDPTPPLPMGSTHDLELKELKQELDALLDPAGKATMLRPSDEETPVQRLWQKATKNCPQVLKALSPLGHVVQPKKNEMLMQGMSASLRDCACKADIPLIRGLLYFMLRAKPMAVAWVSVGTSGDRLVRPAGEPWSKSHLVIIEASKKQRAQQKRVPLVLDSAL